MSSNKLLCKEKFILIILYSIILCSFKNKFFNHRLIIFIMKGFMNFKILFIYFFLFSSIFFFLSNKLFFCIIIFSFWIRHIVCNYTFTFNLIKHRHWNRSILIIFYILVEVFFTIM